MAKVRCTASLGRSARDDERWRGRERLCYRLLKFVAQCRGKPRGYGPAEGLADRLETAEGLDEGIDRQRADS